MSSSSRGMIRAMMIIGSAQVLNILISITRIKILAVLLGPAGIGLLSLFNNLKEMAVLGGSLGMETSGVRQIASHREDAAALSRIRRVLRLSLLVQGLLAMGLIWVLRDPLALWLMGHTDYATEVGLVGLAVFFAVVAGSQTALLQGLREIGPLARVTVLGALAGSVAGLVAVWFLGTPGLIWFVVVQPACSVLVAVYYTRRLPRPVQAYLSLRDIAQAWGGLLRLGIVFVIGALLVTGVLLFLRSHITTEMGLDAVGQFAASWGISMIYLGFLLKAMGADYFPRLSETIKDPPAAVSLINDQVQLGLVLGGPLLLLLIGAAPWLIPLMYSAQFDQAVSLLQWQSLGNLFKLPAWALSFAFVAGGKSAIFLCADLFWSATFVGLSLLGLPVLGLDAVGIAFAAAYLAFFLFNWAFLRARMEFRFQRLSVHLLMAYFLGGAALLALVFWAPVAGGLLAVSLALGSGFVGGHIVLGKIGSEGRLPAKMTRFYATIGWPVTKG